MATDSQVRSAAAAIVNDYRTIRPTPGGGQDDNANDPYLNKLAAYRDVIKMYLQNLPTHQMQLNFGRIVSGERAGYAGGRNGIERARHKWYSYPMDVRQALQTRYSVEDEDLIINDMDRFFNAQTAQRSISFSSPDDRVLGVGSSPREWAARHGVPLSNRPVPTASLRRGYLSFE